MLLVLYFRTGIAALHVAGITLLVVAGLMILAGIISVFAMGRMGYQGKLTTYSGTHRRRRNNEQENTEVIELIIVI